MMTGSMSQSFFVNNLFQNIFLFPLFLLFLTIQNNTYMRSRRSDRNHIIYTIRNKETDQTYIGITVVRGKAYIKSIKIRLKQHIHRALTESRDWSLCKSIREFGPSSIEISINEIVRGKSNAHSREIELIKLYKPQLNTASI